MVECKRKAVLSASLRDIQLYNPPRGINLQCWEFDDYTKQVFTQWVCNSETPTLQERRNLEDIDRELANLKVVCDRVRNQPNSLDGQQQKFECNLSELNGELDKLRHKSHNRKQEGFGDLLI